mmetsp:Transcript_55463/g.110174  ORF Transcript_55463/g.110174 Transcript_55463/m.110174 type:complete len:204 (-) Transcript_55463:136-747(-)
MAAYTAAPSKKVGGVVCAISPIVGKGDQRIARRGSTVTVLLCRHNDTRLSQRLACQPFSLQHRTKLIEERGELTWLSVLHGRTHESLVQQSRVARWRLPVAAQAASPCGYPISEGKIGRFCDVEAGVEAAVVRGGRGEHEGARLGDAAIDGDAKGSEHHRREDACLPIVEVRVLCKECRKDDGPYLLHLLHVRGRHAVPDLRG